MRAFLARYALEFAVFICGAVVMIYEIIGSRIVAPYIGTSTYIWTSLIGVILAALSLGYWLGGRMADKRPDVKILAAAIFFAGGLISLTVLIKDAVLSAIHAAGGPLELKSVVAAILLFAPASVLLGFVTPYAVKLRTLSLADSGKTVGRLYALSTVGSIAGTFAAGFFLIPFIGSTRTLYFIAGSLIAVSILLTPLAFTRATFAVLILFALGIGTNELMSHYMRTAHNFIDIDTEYSRVQIYEATHPETGRRYRAIATDPYFAQSAIYLDDGSGVFEYPKFFHLVQHFKPDHQRTLMIGGAGYTFPREYLDTYPDASIDVVEIDRRMTAIAKEMFGLNEDPRMQTFHEDGRSFVNRVPGASYDAVFVDAFGSMFSIPYHLTTVEAVHHMRRILKDDGVVIVNIGSAFSGPGGEFLRSEFATYKAVFPDVVLFKVRPERPDTELQNAILVACRSACRSDRPDNDSIENDVIPSLLSRRYGVAQFGANEPVLSDDLAPVDLQMNRALHCCLR